jgi:asparagine synthase (glutamine-hydrolysing)
LFVGEILNHNEFFPVKFLSDTHAIGALFSMHSVKELMNLMEGFYSILIYDKTTCLLHVITDPLGKKPIYINTKTTDISSEIKALCVNKEYNPNQLYFSRCAKWGYSVGQRTFDLDIRKIPAGVHMIIDPHEERILNIHDYLIKRDKIKIKYNIISELEKSIKYRLLSDIPISILLSGGLDSSIIFTLLRKLTNNFIIFHIDNGEEEYLNYLDIPQSIPIKKIQFNQDIISDDLLNEILYYNESPFDLGSMIPQYLLGREIAKHNIHIAITGDGADELFGGYTRTEQYDSQYSDIFDELIYYHLPRLDKFMMAHTIEVRNPFLSLPILQFAFSLQYPDRIRKSYLKKAFRGLVPDEIIDRPKVPLKINRIKSDPMEYRLMLLDHFQKHIIPKYYKGEKP